MLFFSADRKASGAIFLISWSFLFISRLVRAYKSLIQRLDSLRRPGINGTFKMSLWGTGAVPGSSGSSTGCTSSSHTRRHRLDSFEVGIRCRNHVTNTEQNFSDFSVSQQTFVFPILKRNPLSFFFPLLLF